MVSNGFSDRLAKFLSKILKTRENEGWKVVSNGFSARQAMSTLKCHGKNFRPEIYFINLRLLNSNAHFTSLAWPKTQAKIIPKAPKSVYYKVWSMWDVLLLWIEPWFYFLDMVKKKEMLFRTISKIIHGLSSIVSICIPSIGQQLLLIRIMKRKIPNTDSIKK